MALLSAMTELEAVNKMLRSIGQAPVNSLAVAGIGDVADAIDALTTTARDVQTVGYWFNTDENYDLTVGSDGYIRVPEGVLELDPQDPLLTVSVRLLPDESGFALWDGDNLTFTWAAATTVPCKIIWGFSFDTLPASARTYIATAAARRFQAQKVSSTILDRYDEIDEERAFTLMQRRDRAARDTNTFRRSLHHLRWGRRRAF